MRAVRMFLRKRPLASLSLLVLSWGSVGRMAFAASYYNLGAFWHKAAAASVCMVQTPQLVQVSDSGNSSSAPSTPSFTETAGNTLIATVSYHDPNETFLVTDTAGNTWHPLTRRVNPDSGCGTSTQIWYATQIVGGANQVSSLGGPGLYGEGWLQVYEYSGLDSASLVVDESGGWPSSPTASMNVGTLNVGGAGALILAAFSESSGSCGGMVPEAGYTSEFVGWCNVNMTADQFVPAGSYLPLATNVQSDQCWVGAAVALRPGCVQVSSPQPTISTILPWAGPTTGGTTITITGTQFDSASTVTVGGNPCTIVGRMGSTQIQCTTPAGSAGLATVTVTDTGGNSASQAGFSYAGCSTISLVQAVPAGGQNNIEVNAPSLSQAITETAGNLLVATVAGGNNLGAPYSVSDTLGNTWYAAAAQSPSSNGTFLQIYYAQNILGGANTVTVSQSPYDGNSWSSLTVLEYSGVAASDAVDISTGQVAQGVAAPSTGSMSLTSDCKELVVASYQDGWGGTAGDSAAGSGWFARVWDRSGPSSVQDNLPGGGVPGTSVNATFVEPSGATTSAWSASQIAFRAAGSALPTQPTHLAFTTSSQSLSDTWDCSGALTVQAQGSSNQPVHVSTPVSVTLSGSGLAYYADDDCENAITSTTIAAGEASQTVYFRGAASGSETAQVSSGGLTGASQNETIAAIAPFTWIGGASCNGSWETAACWQGGVVPGASDTAHFDGNCSSNCSATLGADESVNLLWLHTGFAGTLNMNGHGLTVGTNLSVEGGTLSSGSGTLDVQDTLAIIGGTVHYQGLIKVRNSYLATGGTVTTAGSTLAFDMVFCPGGLLRIFPGSVAYNNVSFVDRSGCGLTRTMMGGSMTVNGTLTIDSVAPTRLDSGTILAKGDIVFGNNGYLGTAEVRIAGSGNQLIDATGAASAYLPAFAIASTGGTVAFKGAVLVSSNYTYQSGTLDFTTFGATLGFNDSLGCSGPNWTLKPGNAVYGNVWFNDERGCGDTRRTMDVSDTMTVAGTLTLQGIWGHSYLEGGKILAKGPVVLSDDGYFGTTDVRIAGNGNQLVDASSTSEGYVPSFSIASTGGIVQFKGLTAVVSNFAYISGALDFTTFGATLGFDDGQGCAGPSWSISPGAVTYGNVSFLDSRGCGTNQRTFDTGSTMKVGGNLYVGGTGELHGLFEGTIEVHGNLTMADKGYRGSTLIRLVGSSNQLVDSTALATDGRIPSLAIASTGGTVTFNGDPIVQGSWIYQSGTVDFTTHDVTLVFIDDYTCSSPTWSITPGTLLYHKVSFVDDRGCGAVTRNLDPGSTMTVLGLLELSPSGAGHWLNGGTLEARGNVSIVNGGYLGTTQLLFSGNTAITLSNPDGELNGSGDVTFAKTGSSVTLQNDLLLEQSGQNLNVTSGTLLMNGSNVDVNGQLTVGAGATVTRGGGTLTYGSVVNNGTIN